MIILAKTFNSHNVFLGSSTTPFKARRVLYNKYIKMFGIDQVDYQVDSSFLFLNSDYNLIKEKYNQVLRVALSSNKLFSSNLDSWFVALQAMVYLGKK